MDPSRIHRVIHESVKDEVQRVGRNRALPRILRKVTHDVSLTAYFRSPVLPPVTPTASPSFQNYAEELPSGTTFSNVAETTDIASSVTNDVTERVGLSEKIVIDTVGVDEQPAKTDTVEDWRNSADRPADIASSSRHDGSSFEALLQRTLEGRCSLSELPPLNKKVFRIFFSSTFSDTKEERNVLMERIYPKLSEFCRTNYGMEFQVVDMRWGVPEHASDSHSTTELCLQEISKCQEVSAGPNFVALIGDKYGYRPIPTIINAEEFNKLCHAASAGNDQRWTLVSDWYQRDNNSIPATFRLQTISNKLKDFNNQENFSARQKAQLEWNVIEQTLKDTLRFTARRAVESGALSNDQIQQYFMSVTENEITKGILDRTLSSDQCKTSICIIRKIVDIDSHLNDSRASKFIDLVPIDSTRDFQAQQLLQELRSNKITHRLPNGNISTYEIDWDACGAGASTQTQPADDKRFSIQYRDDHDGKSIKMDCNDKEQSCNTSGNAALTNEIRQSNVVNKLKDIIFDESKTNSENVLINTPNVDKSIREKLFNTSNEEDIIRQSHYLRTFCEHFYEKLKSLIQESDVVNQKLYDEMTVEVLQHLHFARQKCKVFEGRQDEISSVKEYLSGRSTKPMIIYGKSGSGKTSVMAKVFEEIDVWTKEAANATNKVIPPEIDTLCKTQIPKVEPRKIITILRFLGTTPHTSNLRSLLSSLCSQLSVTYSSHPWKMPEKMSELINDFHNLLKLANKHQRLLLLLDSVDQLMPTYDAYNVAWLPNFLPRYVKLIVSTLDEGYEILQNLRIRYEKKSGTFLEIKELGKDIGLEVISQWLNKSDRCITTQQRNVVCEAFKICSLPLYARIAFDQIRKWCSYDHPTSAELETTVHGAINQLFDQMEQKFGKPIVKHSLSYLTAARHGLSEVELEHMLSLDDELLEEVFRFWCPPVRRVPPLLWTRVRADINSYVVERSADDILVLCWYHRQFIAATKARYLSDENFKNGMHQIMAEYFSGRWGGGKKKPFKYTDAQMKRFQLNESLAEADRKVPVQPYLFSNDETNDFTEKKVRINARKASELPYHFLKIGNKSKLLKTVLFNYEWLFAKLCSSSTQAILQEFDYLKDSDEQLCADIEIQILVANLQLIRPYIDTFPKSLGFELTGRLAKYVGSSYPHITRLVGSCDTFGVSQCNLAPTLTCFESADLGLKHNISVRSSEPWHEGGAMTCTVTMKTMYIVDYDQDDKPNLYVWDVKNSELLMSTPLKKSIPPDVMDVYIQLKLINNESHLLACYIRKYYGISKERVSGDGFIDVISVTDGSVLRTFQEYLYKQPFNNCLLYNTKNYVGIRFGWKVPLVNIWTGERINLTQPHRLTNDETKFLRARSKKATIKSYHGDEKVLGYTRIKTATISNFSDSTNLGEFLKSDSFSGLTISSDNSLALLADALGNINVYDIGSTLSDGKLIKVKTSLSLPSNEKITVFDLKRNDEEKQCIKQTLIVSPNDQYLIVCYQGISTWEAFAWNILSGHFIRRLAKNRPTDDRYPSFSHDSRFIVDALTSCVNIHFSDSGIIARTYQFGTQRVRSIYISECSMEIVVLVGKEVIILELSESKKLSSKKSSQFIDEKEIDDIVLLAEEVITNDHVHPRIVLKRDDLGKIYALEISPLIKNDQLGLSSLIENSQFSVLSWITPKGHHFIELLAHVQIIDIQLEEIVYTPKPGDVIQRIDSSIDPPQTKLLNFPVLDTIECGLRMTELFAGDRVIREDDNKIRFRVIQTNRFRVVTVPSVIAIDRNKLRDSHHMESQHQCITIYQEEVATISNSYLVTIKTKHSKEFVNIYDIEQAKFVTSHEGRGDVETQGKRSGSVVRITINESKLLIADNLLNLRVFSGQNFTDMIASIAPFHDISSFKNFRMKNLYLPPMNTNVCILHLMRDTRNIFSSTSSEYIHINLTSKSCSLPLNISTALDDISLDGKFGITDRLVLYSLPTATIWKKIPYKKFGVNMQVQARISEDNGHVVFIDKQDDTIHVVKLLADLSSPSVRYVASCFTHAPNVPVINGFTLRHHGRVVVIRGGSSPLVFALSSCRGSKRPAVRSKDLKIDWSETDRALLLVT